MNVLHRSSHRSSPLAAAYPRLPLILAVVCVPLWAEEDHRQLLDAVTVVGTETEGYQATQASVGGFDEAPLLDTPASISVITQDILLDQQARLLSEVLRNDASVGDSYAPVGYYENFQVRGYSLNSASSYKINGRTIAGEQNVALENKERVEVLKGLSGLQSGVSEPGGLINYVTKRPEDVRALSFALDADGSRYLATDVGGWFGSEQQLGLRVNMAHEDIGSYVEHADGQRDFASLALDWNLSPNSLLQLDVEYQMREQRSVPGYQLLGGKALPHHVSPKDMLAYQSWANPVGIESLNISGRYEYRLNDDWKAAFSASRSRVVIDDYSAFAWGCWACSGLSYPYNTFAPNGDYDISDYRSPDDTRRNDEAQATLSGRFQTGPLQHELTVGGSGFQRLVDRRASVNEWIGSGNINQAPPVLAPYAGPLGHTSRRLDSRQYGLFASDRIRYGEHWQLILGGRELRLDEKSFNKDGSTARHTQRSMFLPQVALLYKPVQEMTLYTSYSEGLSLGGEAPWFTTNADEFLAPTVSRQVEAGFKYDWQRLSLSATLFQIRKGYQYSQPDAAGDLTYVSQGQQKNTGLELSAVGHVTDRLQLSSSVALIRSRVANTGTEAYEGHQALNVPTLRAALYVDYAIPGVPGLALLGGLQTSSSKYSNRLGDVKAGGYTLFNLGGRYSTRVAGYDSVFRLSVDNLFDKRYWRDVGESAGDGYLFQGAPRTVRLTTSVNF